MPPTPVDVFISSTCYDLSDLRQELCHFLQSEGFLVRLSDVPESDFSVDPTVNSIHSCLKNVEACDVVVVVLDHRYGPPLPATIGEYAGLSATHAEVRHAVKHKKPVLYFIRDRAFNDFEQLRRDPGFNAQWVESKEPERRKLWLGFVKEMSRLPGHVDQSNWLETFKSSVDLKPLVLKRLISRFPSMAGSRALEADRLVRMTLEGVEFLPDDKFLAIKASMRNIGPGPALNVSWGRSIDSKDEEVGETGGAMEGETRTIRVKFYRLEDDARISVFCIYENRFRDRYKVELTIRRKDNGASKFARERLFVEVGPASAREWVSVD